MAGQQLPFGQLTPTARPIGAFVSAANPNLPEPAKPALLGAPDGVTTMQMASGGSVQGYNQLEELAQSLAPFSDALMKLGQRGALSYVGGKIDQGYYSQLKELQARSLASLQQQQEAGAANAAAAVSELQKIDPPGARLLQEANPWVAVGRRRALAQVAGGEIDDVLLNELTVNRGRLAGLTPGSPELLQTKAALTAKVLQDYGLSEDDPEVAVYVTPRLNQAWDSFTAEQRTLWRAELTRNTADTSAGSALTLLSQLIGKEAETTGVPNPFDPTQRIRKGEQGYALAAGLALTGAIDRQLSVLAGDDKAKAWEQIKGVLAYAAKNPALAEIIKELRLGDPNTPLDKRPRWVDANPVEFLQMQNTGLKALNENFEQQQQGLENSLDGLWYGQNGPGGSGAKVDTAEWQQQANWVRAEGIRAGYRDVDGYIQTKYNQALTTATAVAGLTGEQQAGISNWVENLSPEQLSPQNIARTRAEANRIANLEPTAEARERRRRELQDEITRKEKLANDMPAGVLGQIKGELRRDAGLPAIKALDPDGTVSPLLALPGTTVAGAAAAAPRKLADFLVGVENLYTRYVGAAMTEYRQRNPAVREIPAAQQNVIVSGAIAKARQSAEYKELLDAAKQPAPGAAPANGQQNGNRPGTTPTSGRPPAGIPQNARGVPIRQARQLPDSTAKAYAARPVLDPQSIYAELKRLEKDKPVSRELYDLATRAGTSTTRYLLEQLKFYPQLDRDGSVKTYLQERLQRERAANTVSSANFAPATGTNLGMVPTGYNAFSPGSWLMRMFAPPAAAATRSSMEPTMGGGGNGAGSFRNPVPGVNFTANRGGYDADTGLDIHGPEGTSVVAALPGRIVYAEKGHSAQMGQSSSSRGYKDQHSVLVELDQPFTYNGKTIRYAWYSHMQGLDPGVAGRNGARISAGQRLGEMGIANGVSHLHFGLVGDREQNVFLTHREIRQLFASGGPAANTPTTRTGGGLTGIASYYSGSGGQDGVAGGRTANNEIYDPNKMTAAVQWSLRGKYLNKWVTVEDLNTGKTVRVWVNDVGPMGGTRLAVNSRDPRVIDLSPAAFRALFGGTSQGVGRVRIIGAAAGNGPRASAEGAPPSAGIASADEAKYGRELGQIAMGSDGVVSDATQGLFDGAVPFDGSAMEQDMGDVAGLRPLPTNRMAIQAGRPMTGNAPDRHQQTIDRHIKANEAKEDWNPLLMENQQRLNNTNPNPRSRPSHPTATAVSNWLHDLKSAVDKRARNAFHNVREQAGTPQFTKGYFGDLRDETQDLSGFLTEKEERTFRQVLFDFLDGKSIQMQRHRFTMENLPYPMAIRFRKAANDYLYEWNERQKDKVSSGTVPVRNALEDRRTAAFAAFNQRSKDWSADGQPLLKLDPKDFSDRDRKALGLTPQRLNDLLYEWNTKRLVVAEAALYSLFDKKANANPGFMPTIKDLPGQLVYSKEARQWLVNWQIKRNEQRRQAALDMLDMKREAIRTIDTETNPATGGEFFGGI